MTQNGGLTRLGGDNRARGSNSASVMQAHTALTVRSPGGLTQMALGNLHPLLHGGGPLDKSHVWDLQRLAG